MAEIRRYSRADRRQSEEMMPAIERRGVGPRELALRVERKSPTHVVLHVANEFVVENSYLLDEALERLSLGGLGPRIELEMSRVPYADSAALGRLVFWSRKLAQDGGSLVAVNPTPYVTSIMDMMRLDKVVRIVHPHTSPGNER